MKILFLLAGLALLPLSPLRAATVMVTYMVNPATGDDATADGTTANPYQSLPIHRRSR